MHGNLGGWGHTSAQRLYDARLDHQPVMEIIGQQKGTSFERTDYDLQILETVVDTRFADYRTITAHLQHRQNVILPAAIEALTWIAATLRSPEILQRVYNDCKLTG